MGSAIHTLSEVSVSDSLSSLSIAICLLFTHPDHPPRCHSSAASRCEKGVKWVSPAAASDTNMAAYTPIDYIPSLVHQLRANYQSGLTRDLSFRRHQVAQAQTQPCLIVAFCAVGAAQTIDSAEQCGAGRCEGPPAPSPSLLLCQRRYAQILGGILGRLPGLLGAAWPLATIA